MDKEQSLRLIAQHRDYFRRLGVRRLGLFGSTARGQATEDSDVDVVVEFSNKSFDAYMELKEFLEEPFKCNVDVVLLDSIKPALRSGILKETVYATGI